MDMQSYKAAGGTGARIARLGSLLCLGVACGILAVSLLAPAEVTRNAKPLFSDSVSAR
jgi:hypothetical protein